MAMIGRHDIVDGKVVTVAKAAAQLKGVLVHCANVHSQLAEIGCERNLVIDPGSRI